MKDLIKRSRAAMPEPVERMAYSVYRNAKYVLPIALRKVRKQQMVVIVATAHKVGSTWLFHLVRDLGRFENKLLPSEFMHHGTIVLDNPEVFPYLLQGYGYSIYKSHSYPLTYELPASMAEAVRFLTIYRDPRDAIVSASFYVAHLEPERGGWGSDFKALSVPRRIETLIGKGDFLLTRLEQWYRTPMAYKVRYEDLLERPVEEVTGAVRHLGLHCTRDEIERVCEKHSFKAQSGRNPGEENGSAFLRKGIAGDWKNHFDEACTAAFKQAYDGRWNRLLVEMGYETSPAW